MTTRTTLIWKRLGKLVDYQFSISYRKRFAERYGGNTDLLLDVDLYMEDYLKAYPSEKNSSAAPFDLAKLIELGEWPPPPAPPAPPPAAAGREPRHAAPAAPRR